MLKYQEINLSSLPHLDFSRGDLKSVTQVYLQAAHDMMMALHEKRGSSIDVLRFRSAVIDHLIQQLFIVSENEIKRGHSDWQSNYTVVSQGGYGRRELCLHSDVDLLFLYEGDEKKYVETIVEKILHPLWDLGLDIGHATRTVPECKHIMLEDLTVLTSMMDARFLIGSEKLWDKFHKGFWKTMSQRSRRQKFYDLKLNESRERMKKFGDSIYLLEPNIKDGEGGLRDYHSVLWLYKIAHGIDDLADLTKKGYAKSDEVNAFYDSLQFMWTVRNELHRLTKRKNDQLVFQYQSSIAQWLGLSDSENHLAVEKFMQQYYTHASQIYRLSDRWTRKLFYKSDKNLSLFSPTSAKLRHKGMKIVRGRLALTDQSLIQEDPFYILRLFLIALENRLELDEYTKEYITDHLYLMDDAFRESPVARDLFFSILSHPGPVKDILDLMHELGVLGQYLPEFKTIHFRFQHTIYHLYTVDTHSIISVHEFSNLLQDPIDNELSVAADVARHIQNKGLLAFAIFYHDIGKGGGAGHVERGAQIIRQAGRRLQLSSEELDLAEFLVRSHLIMTRLAFRRDLDDPGLIIHFAKSMPSLEHLNHLYILTLCDVKATNPYALTHWRANLLRTLFLKARQVIEEGIYTPEKVVDLISKIQQQVTHLSLHHPEFKMDSSLIGEFMAKMPPRYFFANSPETILRHISLSQKMKREGLVIEHQHHNLQNVSEIIVIAPDSPRLFSKLCGVMMAYNVNVLAAQLNVSKNGEAYYVLTVTDVDGSMIKDDIKWQRICQGLYDVLTARVFVKNLVAEKFKPSLLKKSFIQKQPTKIELDNDISAYYTVIDIMTNDRVGLLYHITSTLYSLGLYVEVSKILTKANVVNDVFYVKDIFGHKIVSEERLKKIKEQLYAVIDEG